MKLISIAVCIALLICSLVSCEHSSDEVEKETITGGEITDMDTLTLNYVIENCGVSAEAFDGVDFDEFVGMYELTESNVCEYHIPDLISMYKKKKAKDNSENYSVIFDDAHGELAEDDIAWIEVLVLEMHDGSDNLYLIADLKKSSVYLSEFDIFLNGSQEYKTADINEEDRDFLIRALTESGITAWQSRYEGTDEGTTGHLAWAVGIRLNDGRCICYSGFGVSGSGTPREVFELTEKLYERFINTIDKEG